MVVPQHRTRVVVRPRIQGGAEERGVLGVVGAAPADTPGGPVVDRSETRGREGGEDLGMRAHRDRSPLGHVTGEPGADQVEGVPGVGPGAGGTAGGPPVPARDTQPSAGLALGAVGVEHLPRLRIPGSGHALQMDRVRAATGTPDLLLPPIETGSVGDP